MPDISAFMPTYIAKSLEYAETLHNSFAILDMPTKNVAPIEGTKYQSIVIGIPKGVTSADRDNGDFNFDALDSDSRTLSLDTLAQAGVKIPDITASTSPVDFVNLYLDPAVNAVLTQISGSLKALCNTTNLNVNGTADNTGGVTKLFSVDNFLAARAALATRGVKVNDVGKMWFINNEIAYHKMLGDSAWTAATAAGDAIANSIRTSGSFPMAFSTNLAYDQVFAATGTGTTHLYPGVYGHSNAFGLVVRQTSTPPSGQVESYDLNVKGIPLKVKLSYSHEKNAWLLSVSCLYGVGVIRPEQAIVVSVKETP